MKALLYHIQLNVSDIDFYRELFNFLEYRVKDDGRDYLGATDGQTDIWVMRTDKAYDALPYHRKARGLNHLAFRVPRREDVDRFSREFLGPRNLPTLYNSPRAFPEYHPDYYAVYFEDPSRIKLEVVFRSADVPAS
ncbi:MAG: VOC family protein [Tepidisphaeraceae bacterium]|jgi:catechol 2,3-dioxygenase-like lactoylglutathione lyase family enzyme